MSKLTKFLSLGIDMMQALPEERFEGNTALYERRLNLHADMLEKALKAAGTDFSFSAPEADAAVKVSVKKDGAPVLCEVRFYHELPGEQIKSEYDFNGRIDFVRKVTGDDGLLIAKIPAGDYLVKISKGSEYENSYYRVSVKPGETAELNCELKAFVDLSKEGYFAGDIHHHSIYSSPVWGGTDDVIESPGEVADSMRALGLKYGALSDHHNILNHEEWKKTACADFCPIPSKEISTSNGHVLSLGVDGFDVIYKIPKAEDRSEEYLRKEFVRITDEIREKGGLPQLNHPRDRQVSISWNPDFYDMTEIFETIEIWNGSNPMYYGTTNAKAADFWRSLLEQGRFIPITSGSDTHNTRADDYNMMYCGMNKIIPAVQALKEKNDPLYETYRYEFDSFLLIVKEFLPMLEVWAKTSLTSGCVRTYVKLEGEPDKDKVLDALRHGRSFITNGPILTISVNGKGMGETVKVDQKADLKIRLQSNRKLKKLSLYTSKNRAVHIPLKDRDDAPSYDYSMELKDFDLSDSDYIFAVASSDVTNLAITNPVIIERQA